MLMNLPPLQAKNKKEREQLDALKTDEDKEAFVKRIYKPRYNGVHSR